MQFPIHSTSNNANQTRQSSPLKFGAKYSQFKLNHPNVSQEMFQDMVKLHGQGMTQEAIQTEANANRPKRGKWDEKGMVGPDEVQTLVKSLGGTQSQRIQEHVNFPPFTSRRDVISPLLLDGIPTPPVEERSRKAVPSVKKLAPRDTSLERFATEFFDPEKGRVIVPGSRRAEKFPYTDINGNKVTNTSAHAVFQKPEFQAYAQKFSYLPKQ